MAGEFINQRPKFLIEEEDLTGEVAKSYGVFAYRLIRRIRKSTQPFASDFILVGDNWYQELTINPFEIYPEDVVYNAPERHSIAPILSRRCYSRPKGSELQDPVMELLEAIDSDSAFGDRQTARLAESFGVVDFTSVGFPAFPESDRISGIKTFPWGRTVRYGPYTTLIYHIENLNYLGRKKQ